jgi:hypothetical protein
MTRTDRAVPVLGRQSAIGIMWLTRAVAGLAKTRRFAPG